MNTAATTARRIAASPASTAVRPTWAAVPSMATRTATTSTTAQSFRSRLAYTVAPGWQLRHTLGVFALDSEFDNTYLTGPTPPPARSAARAGSRTCARATSATTSRPRVCSIPAPSNTACCSAWNSPTGPLAQAVHRRHARPRRAAPCRRWTCTTGPVAPAPGRDDDQQRRAPQGPHQGYYAQDQIKLNEGRQVLLGLRLDRFNIDSTNRSLDASASRSSSGVVVDASDSFSRTAFSPTGGGPHRHHAQRARQHQ